MHVIALISQKGGAGKTTLAAGLAVAGARAIAVLNAAPVQGPLADEALTALAGYELAVAPMVIHQRIAHVHAFTAGLTASELKPAGKAASELAGLYHFVMHILAGETP